MALTQPEIQQVVDYINTLAETGRQLQDINSSGELTEIKLGGTDTEKVVLTKEQIDELFGDFEFIDNEMFVVGKSLIEYDGGAFNINSSNEDLLIGGTIVQLDLSILQIDSGSGATPTTKEWTLSKFQTGAEADDKYEQSANKGTPDGYCPLGSDRIVPAENLPPSATTYIPVKERFEVTDAGGQSAFTLSRNLIAEDLVFIDGVLFEDFTGIGTTTLTTDYAITQGSVLTYRH